MIMARTKGGLHTLNGRGFLAHALEAKLSPLVWYYFDFNPLCDPLEIEPGDWVSFPDDGNPRGGHGWIANFIPVGEGRFRVRVLAMPPYLNLGAVTDACGEPIPLDGLALLPPRPEPPSRLPDPPEGNRSLGAKVGVNPFPTGREMKPATQADLSERGNPPSQNLVKAMDERRGAEWNL